MADEKERDIVKQLALSSLAVAAVFWSYKAGSDLIDARREGKARAVFMPYVNNAQKSGGSMSLSRFVYFDDEFSGSCLEFTQLNRSRHTIRYGGARIRAGKLVRVYPSFEECAARAGA